MGNGEWLMGENIGSLPLGVICRSYDSGKAYRARLSSQYFQESISNMGVFHSKSKRASKFHLY